MAKKGTKRKAESAATPSQSSAEAAAEAALAAAAAAAAAKAKASPKEAITGLGCSDAPVFFEVRPKGPPPAQYLPAIKACCDAGEERIHFTYFAIRGLGEVPRLLLEEAGVAYDSLAVFGSEDQAKTGNWRDTSPVGLLPVVSGCGIERSKPLAQSGAIVRFLAEKYGLAGADAAEKAYADVMFETAKDLMSVKAQLLADAKPDAETLASAKGAYSLCCRLLCQLEKAPDPLDDKVAVTFGQMQLFHALTQLEETKPGVVKGVHKKLEAFRTAMAKRKRIAAYLASPRRFPSTSGELGGTAGYVYGKLGKTKLVRKDLK